MTDKLPAAVAALAAGILLQACKPRGNGALPDDGDKPISLDKPVSIPGSAGSGQEKPVRPAKNAPPL